MKYYSVLTVLFLASCVNPKSAKKIATEENTVDTEGVVKQYIPKKQKQETEKLSQKDIILNEAVAIANDFYNNLKTQNYTGANKHMHPDALSVTSESQWVEIYKKLQEKKGPLGFVKMYDYGSKIEMLGGNGKGDYAELIFDAQYKDGNFREKLTFFRKDSTEHILILGYDADERIERVKIYEGLE